MLVMPAELRNGTVKGTGPFTSSSTKKPASSSPLTPYAACFAWQASFLLRARRSSPNFVASMQAGSCKVLHTTNIWVETA